MSAEKLDIDSELTNLVRNFDVAGVPYAVCGAIALAAHGHPRATKDIDLIVPAASLHLAKTVARSCGFALESLPMHFRSSGIHIERVSKVVGNGLLMLDILVCNEVLEPVWATRVEMPWNDRLLWCVSRQALVSMKLLAGRPQDMLDVARMEEST